MAAWPELSDYQIHSSSRKSPPRLESKRMASRFQSSVACRQLRSIGRSTARPACAYVSHPAAQVRCQSTATTEPHQPDADGGFKGAPSAQKYIKYTSDSYACPDFCEISRYNCLGIGIRTSRGMISSQRWATAFDLRGH